MDRARIWLRRFVPGLTAYAAGAVLLPLTGLADEPSTAVVGAVAVGVALASGAAVVVARWARPTGYAGLGGLVVALAGWLLPQAEPSPVTWLLSIAIGIAVGLAAGGLFVPGISSARPGIVAGASVGLLQVGAMLALDVPTAAAVLFGIAMVVVSVARERPPKPARSKAVTILVISTAVLTVGVGCWIGANSPTATWFGSQVSHGPRDRDRVAITFDDGPNVPYTERIAAVLDDHGATGTFFMVGKALDERPGVARRLMARSHLLANHSYQHDSWRWLDPRYPELERTQDAFRRTLDVCPAFFRAPHGQHTPFMARVVDDHGMTMVGWDVSAGDWKSSDARRVAERVLDQVEPGSIIVLHDGLDGDVTADRSVLVRALPIILEGLERRGLDAVGLDTLLGEEGYGDHC